MSKRPALFAALLLALAFALRMAGIHYGLPSKNLALTTFHPDEPLSFYTIEKWKPEKLYFHPGRAILWGGFHLFPMAAGLKVAQLAGYVHFGNREFYISNFRESDKLYITARFIQVLCATLSVLLVFLIAQQSFGNTAGLLAAGFYCMSAVQIVNSFSTRPDAMMVFLALLALYFSWRVWDRACLRDSILTGVLLGLAAATKYSAAPFGIFPLMIHLLSPDPRNRKHLLYFLGSGLVFFLLGTPYILLDYPWFRQQFALNVNLVSSAIAPVIPGSGFKLYATYFLPYGLGWPLTAAGAAGWVYVLVQAIRGRALSRQPGAEYSLHPWIWAACSLIVYAVLSYPKSQQVWYTLPVVPFIALFAGAALAKLIDSFQPSARLAGCLLALGVFSYTSIYALAHLRLYTGKNVREEASEWIDQNIPKGESIGIARSYFWTPAILRQYHPPYHLMEGGDAQTGLDDCVLGLEKLDGKAKYIVLTEFEYRTYLLPMYSQTFENQARVLHQIMDRDYQEVARFDEEARMLGLRFPKSEYAPYDWIMPNPTIRIFKKA